MGQTVRHISQTVRFQDRQMTDTNNTHSEIKLLRVCKLLYMSHGELLQYKKVVIQLVTSLLELVNLVQKLNYAVDC